MEQGESVGRVLDHLARVIEDYEALPLTERQRRDTTISLHYQQRIDAAGVPHRTFHVGVWADDEYEGDVDSWEEWSFRRQALLDDAAEEQAVGRAQPEGEGEHVGQADERAAAVAGSAVESMSERPEGQSEEGGATA